jgi:hypothetical protein
MVVGNCHLRLLSIKHGCTLFTAATVNSKNAIRWGDVMILLIPKYVEWRWCNRPQRIHPFEVESTSRSLKYGYKFSGCCDGQSKST